jgi:hypothetical protein
VACSASLSPVVKYHGLARRYLMPPRFLMRPLLNGGTLAGQVAGSSDIKSRALRELCPDLGRILEEELEAGNSVLTVKDDWGFVVVLSEPFLLEHTLESKDLRFREVNNRNEWKAEINSKEFKHTLACGFGAGWKPPSKLIRHSALYTLFFLFLLWQFVKDCTR